VNGVFDRSSLAHGFHPTDRKTPTKTRKMPICFGTQAAEQSNEHQSTLRLAARFDTTASPVPAEKASASKPEPQVLMLRVPGDQQKSPSKSTCFEARSES